MGEEGRVAGRTRVTWIGVRLGGQTAKRGWAREQTEKTRRNACARLAQRMGNLPDILVYEH